MRHCHHNVFKRRRRRRRRFFFLFAHQQSSSLPQRFGLMIIALVWWTTTTTTTTTSLFDGSTTTTFTVSARRIPALPRRKQQDEERQQQQQQQAAAMQKEAETAKLVSNAADQAAYNVVHAVEQQVTNNKATEESFTFKNFVMTYEAVLNTLLEKILAVLFYKPPVGLVAVAAVLRLVLTGRIFSLYKQQPLSADVMMQKEVKRQKRHKGRSLILDPDDMQYNNFGGVLHVRQQLCWASLVGLEQEQEQQQQTADPPPTPPSTSHHSTKKRTMSPPPSSSDTTNDLIQALQQNTRPGGARATFLDGLVEPLANVEDAWMRTDSSTTSNDISKNIANASSLSLKQVQRILELSVLTVEVRAMDALLRVCRDRLLKTTYRLARSREHWNRRTKAFRNMGRLLQTVMHRTIEGDRLRYSYSEAAYQAEVTRLGEIVSVLLESPSDMDKSYLLDALKANEQGAATTSAAASEKGHHLLWNKSSNRSSTLLSKYSLRWNADGMGRLSIRKFDSIRTLACGVPCADVLLSDPDTDAWIGQARDWTYKARRVLCRVVRETLQKSDPTTHYNEQDFTKLEHHWCVVSYAPDTDIARSWRKMLSYVESMPSWRRVGEGKVVRLSDVPIVDFVRRLDVLGIPSSLIHVWLASLVHKRVEPHWPRIQVYLLEVYAKVLEILEERVWVPLKGIVNDIMNKSKGIMSAFGLREEEASLDNMLRDLGFGDGTPATRRQALQEATEQYEEDLRSGLFRNVLRGRLVRLLLVQVQQLKVGLLSALDTIDVLMKGNQIHFQLLAAIPAVLIAYFGTRFFLRALYNIRAKDFRPLTVVHGDMDEFLSRIESTILLTDPVVPDSNRNKKQQQQSGKTVPSRSSTGTTARAAHSCLPFQSLGEVVLNIYRYLVLLDFSSPPFPSRLCDQIHGLLCELLGPRMMGRSYNRDSAETAAAGSGSGSPEYQQQLYLSWLNRIQEKHEDLLKYL